MVGVKRGLAIVAVLAAALAEGAGAAATRVDQFGTTLVDGRKVFPIVLAKGPEPGMETPDGRDGLDEVVEAGVNFFKTGPASRPWWPEDISAAIDYNREAAERGAYTWVNLATLSDATPDKPVKEQRLRDVIGALEGDWSASALALWKGADEPWLAGFEPEELQYAYCVATSRGDPTWCGGRPVADSDHLWVTIQAPRGDAADLAPYTAVTDIHGVDHYPVTFAEPDPDLHEIGTWTERIASITPSGAVWTTLQVCASGSNDPGSGQFVLPTLRQERYMIYDAIINGARSLAFYGGNIYRCWNETDAALGWNWTFWDTILADLVREINAASPIAPALVNPGTTRRLSSNELTTQAISREGASASELWVIAARHGADTEPVTISGLPANVTRGTVYTEGRSVEVTNGSFTDTFDRWDVHVYRFTVPPPQPPEPPPPPPPPPAEPPPPPPLVPASAPRVARCVVPNVKRKTVRDARRALARAGCTAGRLRKARSVRVRKGRVIAQSIRPGRRVPFRTRVGLVVSRGR